MVVFVVGLVYVDVGNDDGEDDDCYIDGYVYVYYVCIYGFGEKCFIECD